MRAQDDIVRFPVGRVSYCRVSLQRFQVQGIVCQTTVFIDFQKGTVMFVSKAKSHRVIHCTEMSLVTFVGSLIGLLSTIAATTPLIEHSRGNDWILPYLGLS